MLTLVLLRLEIAVSIGAFVRPIASSAAAEVGFLREGISSLTDSAFVRLAFCGAVMKNPRSQTQKIYFMLKMLKGPTGILPQPFGGNVLGHQPVNPSKVDACYRPGGRKILRLIGSEFVPMSSRRGR